MEQEILDILMDIDRSLRAMETRLSKLEQNAEHMRLELKNEIDQKIGDAKKQILDQHFLFEHEYGTKIDAIFDAVSLELDKNKEKSEKIRKLETRIEQNEIKIFNHEERISRLETKSKIKIQ